ncbi:hypothetical protein HMPREF1552_02380 [Leptotrichia sp. oral taxon 879 str. F0557]|nr:hypothetical protein HMPREF1552_02380 [Leptotrichia sp. oral taxon 879 str. F0557]
MQITQYIIIFFNKNQDIKNKFFCFLLKVILINKYFFLYIFNLF